MPNQIVRPAKMLVSIVGRRRGDQLVAAAKSGGARGGTVVLGKSLGDNWLLQALSLADIQVDVVFIVMGAERESVLKTIREAAACDTKRLEGTAVLLDVPELFIRMNSPANAPAAEPAGESRSTAMESGYKLITVIVNTGYGDDVMAEARKAGATGGTILNARGTGTEEDVKFFGITLVPEKEMLLIVAEKEKAGLIIDAISGVPTLCAPGGGIIFNMNVEEFIVLGK